MHFENLHLLGFSFFKFLTFLDLRNLAGRVQVEKTSAENIEYIIYNINIYDNMKYRIYIRAKVEKSSGLKQAVAKPPDQLQNIKYRADNIENTKSIIYNI